MDRQRSPSSFCRLTRFGGHKAEGGSMEPTRRPIPVQLLTKLGRWPEHPEKTVREEQRLTRGATGAKLLRTGIETSDFIFSSALQERCEIRDPF